MVTSEMVSSVTPPDLQVSQTKTSEPNGIIVYSVVVSSCGQTQTVQTDLKQQQLTHDYCHYSSQAGPVLPDPLVNLRIEGGDPDGTNGNFLVRWEWSENSFDLKSPGATFVRPFSAKTVTSNLSDGPGDGGRVISLTELNWTGEVVRTEKPPKKKPAGSAPI